MIFPYAVLALALSVHLFGGHPSLENKGIVHKGKTVSLVIPKNPLAAGSVKIESHTGRNSFTDWTDDDHLESREAIDKIIQIWKENSINDYLVFARESNHSSSPFSWEVVPYPKAGWWFWKQFKVLYNITFGSSSILKIEQQQRAKTLHQELSLLPDIEETAPPDSEGNDVFCDPVIIARQLIFEGNEINILYSHAPIAFGEKKLHFLIVPKQHRQKFSDLTKSEYLEAMQLSRKLVNFYQRKGDSTVYLFHKTGIEAGQMIPHWIGHVVFAATKTQEFFSKLRVLKNMMFGSSPLSEEEFARRVESLQKELAEALKN